MRKLLTTVAAIAIAAGGAYTVARSSSIPLLSGIGLTTCEEGSQTANCINQLIQSIGTGVTGNFAYVGPTGNSGGGTTTANFVLASATIPTGTVMAGNGG